MATLIRRSNGIYYEVSFFHWSLLFHQNYPDPFNSSTTIKDDVPNAVHVHIAIYDILGQGVDELVNREQAAGRYRIEWKPTNRGSGAYFYRLQAGEFDSVKKLIFIK